MRRRLLIASALACLMCATPTLAGKPPANWDGLALVKSKRFDTVYLLPGVDFRPYAKVMLDPTEVAFQKDWVRDYNRGLSAKIAAAEAAQATAAVRNGFETAFREAYAEAGYPVVTEPGPDVLRVRAAVVNLFVSATDRDGGYSERAGAATVVVEARDSLSGALLGRAVDGRVAETPGRWVRNRVTNSAAFRDVFRVWARISVDGLRELKARSPAPGGTAGR